MELQENLINLFNNLLIIFRNYGTYVFMGFLGVALHFASQGANSKSAFKRLLSNIFLAVFVSCIVGVVANLFLDNDKAIMISLIGGLFYENIVEEFKSGRLWDYIRGLIKDAVSYFINKNTK